MACVCSSAENAAQNIRTKISESIPRELAVSDPEEVSHRPSDIDAARCQLADSSDRRPSP